MISFAVVAVMAAGAVVALAASYRGAPGPRGPQGATGAVGDAGLRGPRASGSHRQDIAINWQNGASEGRDTENFFAPGIGRGQVVCNTQAQQVVFQPYEDTHDTAMMITRIQDKGYGAGTEVTIRLAKRDAFTGKKFNEGLNWQGYSGGGTENQAQGMFVGLISSRGDRGGPGGPGPAPTSFRLTWHWNFGDGNNRCYVAATFLTRYGNG